jgi:hypothetical protein
MKVSDRITSSSARIDFLRPTKRGAIMCGKYDAVAQRQHRIGSGFTWRKRWAWLCSGHGPKSVSLSLSAVTRLMDSFGRCCGCPYTAARFVGTRWISRMSPWCTVAT